MALTTLFGTALAFADELHRKQFRKGTSIPYISHLMSVASLVLEDGGTETEAIAALLHDAIEDQGSTWPGGRDALRDIIRQRFGDDVLRIVEGCTDDEGHVKDDTAPPEVKRARWIARKQAYVEHLRGMDDASVQTCLMRGQTPQHPEHPNRPSYRRRIPLDAFQCWSRGSARVLPLAGEYLRSRHATGIGVSAGSGVGCVDVGDVRN